MARLPDQGQDDGQWGTLLNEFLQVSHRPDGTLENRPVTVKDFGAEGDNTTDDSAAFQAAIDYCISHGQTPLYISEGAYLLSERLVFSGSVDVKSDKTATLRWAPGTSANRCGILLDFEGGGDTLCDMSFPMLFGPACSDNFTIPGYGTNSYDLSSRVGDAILLKGGNRINLYAHYLCGWSSGIRIESSVASTVDNVSVELNTLDFCVKGIDIYTGPAGSKGFAQFTFKANTIWAKFPIYLDAVNGYIHAATFDIAGGALINESGGCGIYARGGGTAASGYRLDSSTFKINHLHAGHRGDSTAGVSTTLVCPFVGGDRTSNGASDDGHSPSVGYFGGHHCEIEIGAVFGMPYGAAASPVPKAGDTIRIRDAGTHNRIRVKYADGGTTQPIPTSKTADEASYNGGVGGAQYSKAVYCQASLGALASGAVENHVIYHQCTSPASVRPFAVVHRNETLVRQSIECVAFQDPAENRLVRLQFINKGSSATAARTVYFWVIAE